MITLKTVLFIIMILLQRDHIASHVFYSDNMNVEFLAQPKH